MKELKIIDWWLDEFQRRTNSINYKTAASIDTLAKDSDTLLDVYAWPESKYELDFDKVRMFIADLLKNQAELSYKQGREEAIKSRFRKLLGTCHGENIFEGDSYCTSFSMCEIAKNEQHNQPKQ